MAVLDVDSHFSEPWDYMWLTDPELAETMPGTELLLRIGREAIGELLRTLPTEQAPEYAQFFPEEFRQLFQFVEGLNFREAEAKIAAEFGIDFLRPRASWEPEARVQLLDEVGIDRQVINPGFSEPIVGWFMEEDPANGARAAHAYNRWAVEYGAAGHTDRLMPTAYVFMNDVEGTVRELTWMRERGSRSFYIPSRPQDGRSLGHVDFDPIWAAAVDLGMMPIAHVGSGPVRIDGAWANTGTGDLGQLIFLGFSFIDTVPRVSLMSFISSGVFDRFPSLQISCQEFRVNWVPFFMEEMDRVATAKVFQGAMGGWKHQLLPSEYVKRNMNFSPIRGERVDIALKAGAPVTFCSDYPHPEGSATAVTEFGAMLERENVDEQTRTAFFSGTIAPHLN